MTTTAILTLTSFLSLALAHGSHDQKPIIAGDADWATFHMAGK